MHVYTVWHEHFAWNLILWFMISDRTVKLKSINWMEIYYVYITMVSSTKMGFCIINNPSTI